MQKPIFNEIKREIMSEHWDVKLFLMAKLLLLKLLRAIKVGVVNDLGKMGVN